MPSVAQKSGSALGLEAVTPNPHAHGGRRLEHDGAIRRRAEIAEKRLGARGAFFVRPGVQCSEFAAQIPDPDPEDKTVAGQVPHRCRHRRHKERVSVGPDQDVGAEHNPLGDGEPVRAARQRLEEGRRKARTRGLNGHRDVIGEPGRGKAQLFSGDDKVSDFRSNRVFAVGRNSDTEPHRFTCLALSCLLEIGSIGESA